MTFKDTASWVVFTDLDGRRWFSLNLPHLEKVNGVGPVGWQRVITRLFQEREQSSNQQRLAVYQEDG